MAQRSIAPREEQSPRELILESLHSQGYSPQRAQEILGLANIIRRRGPITFQQRRELREAFSQAMDLNLREAELLSRVMTSWNDVAGNVRDVSELTAEQARGISEAIRNPPSSPRLSLIRESIGESFMFMYRYWGLGQSFDEAAGRFDIRTVPRRTSRE